MWEFCLFTGLKVSIFYLFWKNWEHVLRFVLDNQPFCLILFVELVLVLKQTIFLYHLQVKTACTFLFVTISRHSLWSLLWCKVKFWINPPSDCLNSLELAQEANATKLLSDTSWFSLSWSTKAKKLLTQILLWIGCENQAVELIQGLCQGPVKSIIVFP